MLLRFSIKNFKTFKNSAVLSFIASNYDKETKESENIFLNKKYGLRVLKSAVVYGANASGKSKLFEALHLMKQHALYSSGIYNSENINDIKPFLLSTETENSPTEFEVVFIFEEVLYRYGFEVSEGKVISEWFYYKPKTKEIELFYRENNEYNVHKKDFAKGYKVVKENLVRDDSLLLSVAGQFNEKSALNATKWFENLKIISGLNSELNYDYTLTKSKDPLFRKKLVSLLKAADLGIQDVTLKKHEFNLENDINSIDFNKINFTEFDINKLETQYNLPTKLLKDNNLLESIFKNKEFLKSILQYVYNNEELNSQNSEIYTIHKKTSNNGDIIGETFFSMKSDESLGTKKYFSILGLIIDSIENGYPLIVDELDSQLHPNLVEKLISMFNSSDSNPNNAQLIFNTHNTNLLNSHLFRKDQIWFINKNNNGEASIYSLADFKSTEVKKQERFEENYLRGKYGGIPYLGLFDYLSNPNIVNENGE